MLSLFFHCRRIFFWICLIISTSTTFAAKCPNGTTIAPATSQTKCQGSAGTLLTASNTESGTGGNPTELYQWYYNTTNSNTISGATLIVGATSSTYTPPTTTVGVNFYFCVVYASDNGCGQSNSTQSLASNVVQVSVLAPPSISDAGSNQTTGPCVTTATLAGNTPAVGTGSWTIVSGPGAVTTPGSPTSGVTGLQSGVATTFRWTISNAPCTASTDDVIITGGACVTYDVCAGAVPVTCSNSYAGTTVGMNTEVALPNCGDNPSAPGVWYVFTGDGSTVTADVCNASTTYDSEIAVYSGASCATLTSCVASNDQSCGNQSSVTFSTVAGTNYYILVNGWSGLTGSFLLDITCCSGTAPGCASSPSPANTATNVSTCNTLTWTAPPGGACSPATGYDIYFGTTNPPPFVTNVATTSYTPVLAGNTTYYWQIRPTNASGTAAGCSIWSFTTNANNQYNLVDDATSAAPYTCVTLTPALNTQRGCSWDQNSTLGFVSNFTYDWTINLGNNDAGADGMAFVIQNDPLGRCKCGATGGSLGAGGITNSLIVELDTYINFEDRDDGMPNVDTDCTVASEEPDHMDIWLNGVVNPDLDFNNCAVAGGERVIPNAIRLMSGGSHYNIENGLDHKLRISWNAGTSTLTASVMNDATTITYATVSYSFNPMTVFGTNSPYFGFTGSTGGLNNQQTFCNPIALLPVEMADFNMHCDEGIVGLNWSTYSEHNNDYFKIERSRDGQTFELVSIIDGSGNSNNLINYSWSDTEILDEIHYYRLSQVDFDGNTKELNIVSSNCAEMSGIQIQSLVQIDGQLQLNLLNEQKGNYVIEIIDCTGKTIAFSSKILESGTNEIFFSELQPSKGIYFVRVSNSSASVVKKVGIF